jgi:hypothetical protein
LEFVERLYAEIDVFSCVYSAGIYWKIICDWWFICDSLPKLSCLQRTYVCCWNLVVCSELAFAAENVCFTANLGVVAEVELAVVNLRFAAETELSVVN